MGKKIKAALLGAGTVGTGVYKLFERRSDVMEQTVGAELELKDPGTQPWEKESGN